MIDFYDIREKFELLKLSFNDNVFILTFIGAVSPIPYKLFVLTAGFLHSNFIVFTIASIIGRAIKLFFVGFVTYKFGEKSVSLLNKYFRQIMFIIVLLLFVYILYMLFELL